MPPQREVEFGGAITNGIRFALNYTVRFSFAVLVVYCCWIPFQRLGNWFSYHVILCTFGYIPLMAEAIMLFVGDDIWSRQLSRRTKYIVHGIIISISTFFIIVGNALVFRFLSPGYHLYTAHGITGLISMIVIIVSLVVGLAANYPEQAKKLVSLSPVCFKFLHNILGLLGYGIGILSLCLGYYTNWFVYYTGSESRLVATILTVFMSMYPLHGAFMSGYRQVKALVS